MSLRISEHAVERFIDRIDSSVNRDVARETIQSGLNSGSRQKEKTYTGDTVFLCNNFRLVVKEENGHREVVTVLSPYNSIEAELDDLSDTIKQLAYEFLEWSESSNGSESFSDLKEKVVKLSKGVSRRQQLIDKFGGIERKRRNQLRQLLSQIEKLKRDLEKQKAHAARMVKERDELKKELLSFKGSLG